MSSPDPLDLFQEGDSSDTEGRPHITSRHGQHSDGEYVEDSVEDSPEVRPGLYPFTPPRREQGLDGEYVEVSLGGHSMPHPLTPTRPEHQLDCKYVEDSPGKGHSTQSRSYKSGQLKDMREAVREEFGAAIPEISLQEFVARFLPPLKKDFNVSEIVGLLKQGELVGSSGHVLKDFEVEPKNRNEHEDVVFAPLSKICEELCRLATQSAESIEAGYFLTMCPNYAPFVEILLKHRPDGCFLHKSWKEFAAVATGSKEETKASRRRRLREKQRLTDEVKNYTLHDMLGLFEVKKELSGQNDNVVKVFFSGQQIIAHDPSRRFVLGITIENTEMRLWFFSRGTPVVSEAFDFTRNIEQLTQVVLSLCFASREELGWDPTVESVRSDSGDREYIIEVNGRKYMTQKAIANSKAHALSSSGTRVWEVIDIETRESRVLKDTWMESDRETEGEIYRTILDDVQRKYGIRIRRFVASHLFTPTDDCLVCVKGKTDYTVDIMTRNCARPVYRFFYLTIDKPSSWTRGYVGPPGAHDIDSFQIMQPKEYPHRMHYRIVFAETAKPVYTTETLSDAFLVLREVAECLEWIHGSGWVHRDISSGNLYFYDGHGLIGDLEYARRKDSTAVAHHMRTTSIDYMASEAIKHRYLFSICGAETPFFHNDLHDLESLWWIVIYMIFFMLDTSFDVEPVQAKLIKRRNTLQALFPRSNTTKARQFFITNEHTFFDNLSWLPEKLLDLRWTLTVLRKDLTDYYIEFESKFPNIRVETFEAAHNAFVRTFKLCEAIATRIQQETGSTLLDMEFFHRFQASEAVSDANVVEGQRPKSGTHQNMPGKASDHSGGIKRKRKRMTEKPARTGRSHTNR
ncbi:hypothetical protein ACEPAH_3076 [Sanghuangporus vaninii]